MTAQSALDAEIAFVTEGYEATALAACLEASFAVLDGASPAASESPAVNRRPRRSARARGRPHRTRPTVNGRRSEVGQFEV